MIAYNKKRLPMLSVQAKVSAPVKGGAYGVGYDGQARVLPGVGGITYNVRVGDPAFGWAGDHIEPGVSTRDREKQDENRGYNILACVGNEARVVSGEAKGSKGVVTGKHGGIEHVIIDFKPEVMEKLTLEDKILVKAQGQGLELTDFPTIQVMNLGPRMLEAMDPQVDGDQLVVTVAAEVPAEIMGSGIGARSAHSGDYDITTQDDELIEELGLDQLRLGDLVAIRDRSSFYGRSYRRGAIEIGIVVHSDSYTSGHGPGVTTLMTANDGEIKPVVAGDANIANLLGLR